jgi:hypothetical protein
MRDYLNLGFRGGKAWAEVIADELKRELGPEYYVQALGSWFVDVYYTPDGGTPPDVTVLPVPSEDEAGAYRWACARVIVRGEQLLLWMANRVGQSRSLMLPVGDPGVFGRLAAIIRAVAYGNGPEATEALF